MPGASDQERTARRQALLSELAEIGMALARDLPRQAAEPDADSDAIALRYSRISRAVRQTLALEARFAQESLEWTTRAARQRGARRKLDVEVLVTRAIEAEFSEAVAGHLVEKLEDRLLDDLDEDYAEAPIPILAAQICQALGVPFDAEMWAEAAPCAPQLSSSSSGRAKTRSGGPMNTGSGDLPESVVFMGGPNKSGHDEQEDGEERAELVGDWSPPRPSG